MPEAVRDLLAAAAEPPTRPVDPVALRRRAHRRSRTAGAGAASLALVVVSVVAAAGVGGPGLSRVALEEAGPSIPPPSTAAGQERLNSVSGTAVPEVPAGDSSPAAGALTGRPPAPPAGGDVVAPPPAPAPESPPPPAAEGTFSPPSTLGPPEPSAAPVRPAPEHAEDGAPAAPAPEALGDQPPPSRTVPLPTHDQAELAGTVHAATVVGDGSREGGCVWLVVAGRPRSVRWEAGATARFGVAGDGSETVEVLDGAGNVVARGGEHITVVAIERPGRLDRCHVGDEAVVWDIALR